MVCASCQKDIVAGSRFCYHCGARQPEAPGAGQPAAAMGPKRLMRSAVDKKLGGVCGGMAEYFDMDPTVVRIAWVLLTIFTGLPLIAYFVFWIVMPEAPVRSSSTTGATVS